MWGSGQALDLQVPEPAHHLQMVVGRGAVDTIFMLPASCASASATDDIYLSFGGAGWAAGAFTCGNRENLGERL